MIFIPPLLAVKPPHSSFVGLLLGLFFVNALHSLTHLLIGVWDWRPTATSLPREPTPNDRVGHARRFVRTWLTFGVTFLGGLLLLDGRDLVLHIITALVAFEERL